MFGVFYRPPTQRADNLLALNNCLLSIAQYPIILCGDFNLPSIDWSLTFPTVSSPAANLMCDLVRDNFLYQMVKGPTRHHNLLDLVFTNQPDLFHDVQVVDNLPLTDHDAVQLSFAVVVPHHSNRKRLLYNYKKLICHFYVRRFLMFLEILLRVLVILKNPGNCLRICFYLLLVYLFPVFNGGGIN